MRSFLLSLKKLIPDLKSNQQLTEAHPVEWFRICFGIVIILQVFYFYYVDFIDEDLIKPIIHFTYPGFSFVKPFSATTMHAIFILQIISGLLIVIGRFIKPALIFYFLSFTYLWLIDKGFFNNHYYLISLITFIMIFIPDLGKNGWKWKKNEITHYLPRWSLQILRFQWFIVFFIAGINKLNKYWLFDFQPLKYTFNFKAEYTGSTFWASDFFPMLFSYGGAIFDIGIGFLLIYPPTRWLAFILMLGFNGFNAYFFHDIGEIGIFPLLVISAFLLFLPSEKIEEKKPSKSNAKILHYLLWVWVIFHCVFPFRHLLYKDYVDWTGEAKRFSWRMKIDVKEAEPQFYVSPSGSQDKYPINVRKSLTPKQYTNLIYHPDMLPQIAKLFEKEAKKQGIIRPVVTADFKVKHNGQKERRIISEDLKLNKTAFSIWRHNNWILSSKE